MSDCYFFTTNMYVGYHGKPLIKDIGFSLKKGEILTLIGPNGAGKSTILKSIAGQLELIGGAVYLDQSAIAGMRREELAKKMSVLLTEKIRAELLTCEEVVESGRYPYTGRFGLLSAEDHQIVAEAMELVHVAELRDRLFDEISDGQKQRVMLARAMAGQPRILILDEPTSYLDVKYKLEFLSVLQEMQKKRGLTVIMSLHELELAERISDKILCVKGEYVERFGTPEEVFQPGYIGSLFEIRNGSYDEESSSMELEAVKGTPHVFVIAGGGSGKNAYRRLQREGIPFATGILFSNDLDTPVAHALAVEVIETEAFEPVDEMLLARAKEVMDSCKTVICCRQSFGSLEHTNKELLAYAKAAGKLIE
ncbi:MAG: ABC transporter ATP-binding protein [Lachnospiraceae bacterium]|nr:ABC transporter ATP-binding protein [bacterium]MDY5517833.1 ABC transporter ATP-binding protein [Lachnospiraceae bacterium]